MSNQETETVSVSYKVLRDSLGNKVYPGDVLLEYGRGGMNFSDGTEYSNVLWEISYPFDGHGLHYDIIGQPHVFAWCSLRQSIKVDFDDLPPEFKYSFYHGMRKLDTTVQKGTLKELIDNSDWKNRIVNPNDVELFHKKKNLKIESIEDIKENIDLLLGPGLTPGEVIYKIFDIVNVKPTPMINGEIGSAAIQDMFNYTAILEKIKES